MNTDAGFRDMLTHGLTPRQIDTWTSRGWIHANGDDNPGSGRTRTWPYHEVQIARLMLRLVNVGFTPAAAAERARAARADWLNRGNCTVIALDDGLTLTIDIGEPHWLPPTGRLVEPAPIPQSILIGGDR
jgi:hypothetical protein